MKLFKRFAAALLVGVMALAMLTACGGGAQKSLAQQAEESLLNSLNNQLHPTDSKNDPELRQKIYDTLGKIKEDGTIDANDYPADAQVGEPTEAGTYVVYTLTNSNGKAREVIGMKDGLPVIAVQEDAAGKKFKINTYDKIAVATRELNGKIYIGAAVQVTGEMIEATPVETTPEE